MSCVSTNPPQQKFQKKMKVNKRKKKESEKGKERVREEKKTILEGYQR